MRAEEFGFTDTAVFDILRDIGRRQSFQSRIAIENTRVTTAPYFERQRVIGSCVEVGKSDSFESVVTTSSAYDAVTCYDVERPEAHIVEVRALQGFISRIGKGNSRCRIAYVFST